MFQEFPYSDMHQLNLDWIIKIAKDFLDQYTHIQQLITDGETSLQTLTENGLNQLQEKADALTELLDQWYETHSEDIANELADALADLNSWYTTHEGYLDQYVLDSITAFGTAADTKAAETLETIPDDYTALSNQALDIQKALNFADDIETILLTYGGYIRTNYSAGSVVDITYQWPAEAEMGNAVVSCSPGDYFMITGAGGSSGRLWAFLNSDNEIITNAAASQTVTNLLITAPENAAKCVINVKGTAIKGTTVKKKLESFQMIDSLFYGNNTTIDCSAVLTNSFKILNTQATIVNGPPDFDDWHDGRNWCFQVYGPFKIGNGTIIFQILAPLTNDPLKRRAFRQWYNNGWSEWEYEGPDPNARITVVVDPNGGGDYTKFTDALSYAYSRHNTTILVKDGVYDITSEINIESMEWGPRIGNGTIVIGEPNVFIKCEYTGSNADTLEKFSPINAGNGDYELHNIHLICKNVRYCVHDEMWTSTSPYIHKYINCTMELNNSSNSVGAEQCIGGGLGSSGLIEVTGGSYKATTYTGTHTRGEISYHNKGGSDPAASIIIVKDVFFVNDTFSTGYYGTHTDKTKVYVSNCSCKRQPFEMPETPEALTDNVDLLKWNNYVRT